MAVRFFMAGVRERNQDNAILPIAGGPRFFEVPFNNRVALSSCNRRHKESVQETAAFLNETFKPWLLNGGFQLVRDYLEQIDLSKHRPTDAPPMTVSKQELMGFSTTDRLEEVLSDIVEANAVLTVKWVKQQYADEFEHGLSDTAIVNALLEMGCKQRRTKAQRYYITPFGFESNLSLNSTSKELEDAMPSRSF